jgi:hypothetical protein
MNPTIQLYTSYKNNILVAITFSLKTALLKPLDYHESNDQLNCRFYGTTETWTKIISWLYNSTKNVTKIG